ncbi:MAG: alginate lyase family protein, partial [Planctomycetes bacterium]|nr:alginate lyase family protein [Planctomycetota bacterium]
MKAKMAAGAQPWLDDWKGLTNSPLAQLGFRPRPAEVVVRGQGVRGPNIMLLTQSAHAAYLCAVRWKISGDEAYAKKAIDILNAWSGTLKAVGGNSDRFLAVGIQGFQLANSGEIMRTYPGWPAEDFQRFQDMMLRVFYSASHDFLLHHNGAVITNYMANWDTCNLSAMLAMGVLCDRRDIYDEAVAYFKNGGGNGAIRHAVTYLHPGYLGQWQESGRDQAHTQAGFGWLANFCEVAWNQGDDLYGYDNNRLLSGAEYIARYNLGKDVPWQGYARNSGRRGPVVSYSVVSPAERGNLRPIYEMVYNHYVNRRGLDAPHVAQAAAKNRPEGGPRPGHSP